MDLSEKVLVRIRKEKIRPIPMWRVFFNKLLKYMLFLMFLLLGGLAVSVLLHQINHTEWSLLGHLSHGWVQATIALVPWLWLILTLSGLALAFFGFRKTPGGHKTETTNLLLTNIILAGVLGAIIYTAGMGGWLNRLFVENLDWYANKEISKARVWMSPDKGLLTGIISGFKGDLLLLEDLNGKIWKINVDSAQWMDPVIPQKGNRINIIGNKTSDKHFFAKQVLFCRGFCANQVKNKRKNF